MMSGKKHSAILASLVTVSLAPMTIAFQASASEDYADMQVEAADFSEGQIAGVINVANERVISVSKSAQKGASNPKVAEYADKMVKEHERINSEFTSLLRKLGISAEETAVSLGLRAEGLRDLATLGLLKGRDFDRKYLHQQGMVQQRVIELLDGSLIPSAKSPELKSYLLAMRGDLLKYNDVAKALQAEVGE